MLQNTQEIHQIVIKSYNVSYLQSACLQLQNLGQLFGFSVSSIIMLPKKTKKYIVLRSPHIYKKAREQFEIRTLKRAVYLKAGPSSAGNANTNSSPLLLSSLTAQDRFQLFYYYLSAYSPFGVSLKITSTRRFKSFVNHS